MSVPISTENTSTNVPNNATDNGKIVQGPVRMVKCHDNLLAYLIGLGCVCGKLYRVHEVSAIILHCTKMPCFKSTGIEAGT